MHELALAESIAQAVRRTMEELPGRTPVQVRLRLGVLAAVDLAALQFGFAVAARESGWDGLVLEAVCVPAELLCVECGARTETRVAHGDCPVCGSSRTMLHGSDELEMESLEVVDGNTEHASRNDGDSPEATGAA